MFSKKIKMIMGVALLASSVFSVSELSFAANNGASSDVANIIEHHDNDGHIYVAHGIQLENDSMKSLRLPEAPAPSQKQLELDRVSNWLYSNKIENGGVFEENGKIIVQVTDNDSHLTSQIEALGVSTEDISVVTVKHSEEELKSYTDSLSKIPEVVASAVNTKQNKIDVFISEDSLNKYKNRIVSTIPEEIINWKIGEYKVVDYVASNPGTTIHSSTNICTSAFNALVNSTKVLVSADHCGLGDTWYTGSSGGSLLGQMTFGFMGSGHKEDAGYIELGSGTTIGLTLNGLSTTIGTFDYNGVRNSTVGYTMKFNFRSGNYSTTVTNGSASISGGETDMVFTNPTSAVSGDSGGLVWSTITGSNGKTYAVIEGVYKGAIVNTSTNTKLYDIYSKLENVYDDLGLTSIYVDSSFSY